jgi:hypothetical protein
MKPRWLSAVICCAGTQPDLPRWTVKWDKAARLDRD